MADRLGLSDDQREELQRLREGMLANAVPLGERYVADHDAHEHNV